MVEVYMHSTVNKYSTYTHIIDWEVKAEGAHIPRLVEPFYNLIVDLCLVYLHYQ